MASTVDDNRLHGTKPVNFRHATDRKPKSGGL